MEKTITLNEMDEMLQHPEKWNVPFIPLQTTELKTNTMEKNEIKKLLYRENPVAKLKHVRKGMIYYEAKTNDVTIDFEVPVTDIGDATFYNEMDSKLLIRYII